MTFPLIAGGFVGGRWKTLLTPTGPWYDGSAGFGNYIVRLRFASSMYGALPNGSALRLTFRANTNYPLPILGCYLGNTISPPSFKGDQRKVTFSGGYDDIIIAPNNTRATDMIPYPFNSAQDLLVAFDIASTGVVTSGGELVASAGVKYSTTATGMTMYALAPGTPPDALNTNMHAGYSTNAGYDYDINLIEVFG